MAPQVRVDELLPIPRDGPAPLYVQAADRVRAMIEHYSLGVGDLLPTIEQLCEAFDVSRQTITKALDSLEFEGVIDGVHGHPAGREARRAVRHPDRFLGRDAAQGREDQNDGVGDARHSTHRRAPSHVERDLQRSEPVSGSAAAIRGDIPVVLVTSVVPPVLGERMRTVNLTDTSFYRTSRR